MWWCGRLSHCNFFQWKCFWSERRFLLRSRRQPNIWPHRPFRFTSHSRRFPPHAQVRQRAGQFQWKRSKTFSNSRPIRSQAELHEIGWRQSTLFFRKLDHQSLWNIWYILSRPGAWEADGYRKYTFPLPPNTVLFVLEIVTSGDVTTAGVGDVCVDDVRVENEACGLYCFLIIGSFVKFKWQFFCEPLEGEDYEVEGIGYVNLPWSCNFGDMYSSPFSLPCGFSNQDDAEFSWQLNLGPSPTNHTGPNDAQAMNQGTSLFIYMYMKNSCV